MLKAAISHIRTYKNIIDIKSLTKSDIWHIPIIIYYNITDRLSITLSSQTYKKTYKYTQMQNVTNMLLIYSPAWWHIFKIYKLLQKNNDMTR